MAAVWLRFRAELRTRWRAWLGLAVLVGLASGAVMALAAGARRTDSAYTRFLEAQNAYDVIIANYPEDGTAVFDFDEIAALPMVADSARADFEYYTLSAVNLVSHDGRIGTEINRFKILEGRRADPDAADEIVVGFALAEEHDLQVGDTVQLIPPGFIELVRSPETAPNPFADELPPEEVDAFIESGRKLLAEIPDGQVRIVGIEASPGEFPPQFVVNRPLVHLTPAAHPLLGDGEHEALMLRLHGGADAVDDLRAELERRSGGLSLQVIAQRDHAAAVQRSIDFQAVALWLLAGLTALAAALIIGQLLARLTYIEATDAPTLRALGMSRRALAALGVVRAAVIGAAGALLGVAGAWAASGAFPVGLARTAEPSPGMALDPLVLTIGVVATVTVMSGLSLLPAWRAARAELAPSSGPLAPSRLARALATPAAPAPATVGVRMALEAERGRTAVPVRTTLAGVILGIATLTAVLTFGASLQHLLATPSLYGVTWDFELTRGGCCVGATAVDALDADDRVDALAVGTMNFPTTFDLEGTPVDTVAFEAVKGSITPAILEGRVPSAYNEIMLGPDTLNALGVHIGDRVAMNEPGSSVVASMAIVGTAVFPTVGENAQLGRGALVTPEGGQAFRADHGDQPDAREDFGVLVRLAPGADTDELVDDLTERLGIDPDFGEGFLVSGDAAPTVIVNFGRVEAMPFVLGGILAAIAGGALMHLLLTAVRRRRRDLAILKTLGFARRQVAGSVAALATTVVAVGLVVGVPLGVAIGRWAWALMADSLGVVSRPQVSLPTLVLVAAAALVVANAVAFLPGQLAARTRPASVLRAE